MGDTAVLSRPERVTPALTDGKHRRWALLGSAVFGALVGGLLVWLVRGALLDDAWISLSYARNLAVHGQWAVTPGLPSNTATSPLFVLLLAVPMLVTGPAVALAVVTAALLAVLSLTTSSLAMRLGWSPWAGPVATALVVTSPLMQASVGLESLLAVALIVVAAHEVATDRGIGVGLAAGALVLTRPDLAVVAMLALALCWRRLHNALPAAVAVVVPWLAASLVMFGTVLPDTLIWKQSVGGAGLGGFMFGEAVVLFWRVWPAVTGLAVAAGAAGLVAWLWLLVRAPRRAPLVLLGVGALAHLATLWALGMAPYPWYPAPAAGAGLVLLALAVSAPGWGRWVAVAACVALVAGGDVYSARHDYAGLGSPLNYNRATPAQYAAIVDRVPDGAVLETYEELGAVAFFCGDRCTVVDPLSDRGRLAPLLTARLATSPLLRALYPGYQPGEPVPATWRVTVNKGGVPTFSGYGGRQTMNAEPITK